MPFSTYSQRRWYDLRQFRDQFPFRGFYGPRDLYIYCAWWWCEHNRSNSFHFITQSGLWCLTPAKLLRLLSTQIQPNNVLICSSNHWTMLDDQCSKYVIGLCSICKLKATKVDNSTFSSDKVFSITNITNTRLTTSTKWIQLDFFLRTKPFKREFVLRQSLHDIYIYIYNRTEKKNKLQCHTENIKHLKCSFIIHLRNKLIDVEKKRVLLRWNENERKIKLHSMSSSSMKVHIKSGHVIKRLNFLLVYHYAKLFASPNHFILIHTYIIYNIRFFCFAHSLINK